LTGAVGRGCGDASRALLFWLVQNSSAPCFAQLGPSAWAMSSGAPADREPTIRAAAFV